MTLRVLVREEGSEMQRSWLDAQGNRDTVALTGPRSGRALHLTRRSFMKFIVAYKVDHAGAGALPTTGSSGIARGGAR